MRVMNRMPDKACGNFNPAPAIRTWLFFLSLLLHAPIGSAQPLLYSFSGQVTRGGITPGAPVSIRFEIDFSLPGQAVMNDGGVLTLQPYLWEDLRIDYFQSRMISGTLFPVVDGGMYNGQEDFSEFLSGWNRSDWNGHTGVLKGGGSDSFFTLERHSPSPDGLLPDWRVQDWQVGTLVQGTIAATSPLDYSLVQASLRLDSIIVIPEPGAASLLLLGAASGWVRLRQTRNTAPRHAARQPA
ncbi:MAG: hypothetical protein NTX27_09815 [Verrucomicrobia bacterium]|nr:hypothetical protein [Verrucomicrobiota bacterium]